MAFVQLPFDDKLSYIIGPFFYPHVRAMLEDRDAPHILQEKAVRFIGKLLMDVRCFHTPIDRVTETWLPAVSHDVSAYAVRGLSCLLVCVDLVLQRMYATIDDVQQALHSSSKNILSKQAQDLVKEQINALKTCIYAEREAEAARTSFRHWFLLPPGTVAYLCASTGDNDEYEDETTGWLSTADGGACELQSTEFIEIRLPVPRGTELMISTSVSQYYGTPRNATTVPPMLPVFLAEFNNVRALHERLSDKNWLYGMPQGTEIARSSNHSSVLELLTKLDSDLSDNNPLNPYLPFLEGYDYSSSMDSQDDKCIPRGYLPVPLPSWTREKWISEIAEELGCDLREQHPHDISDFPLNGLITVYVQPRRSPGYIKGKNLSPPRSEQSFVLSCKILRREPDRPALASLTEDDWSCIEEWGESSTPRLLQFRVVQRLKAPKRIFDARTPASRPWTRQSTAGSSGRFDECQASTVLVTAQVMDVQRITEFADDFLDVYDPAVMEAAIACTSLPKLNPPPRPFGYTRESHGFYALPPLPGVREKCLLVWYCLTSR